MKVERLLSVVILLCFSWLIINTNNYYFQKNILGSCKEYSVVDCNDNTCVVEMPYSIWIEWSNNLSFDIIDSEIVSGREVLECYIPTLNNCVNINGAKVNMQVSICGDACIVGFPMIANSF